MKINFLFHIKIFLMELDKVNYDIFYSIRSMSNDDWLDIVNRIHSPLMCKNMTLMKWLILEDEVNLTVIQRQFIRNFCAFVAAVYDKAYTRDHLDTTLYSYKSNKLVQLELVSETFMTTKDPNNDDHKILQELTEKLQGSRIKDGLLIDINYKMANEILNYLETEHFRNLLDLIVKKQN
jgi:hypothetical protein